MVEERPKRGRGRPRKAEGADVTFSVTLPGHHYDYLRYISTEQRRLGTGPKAAAEHLLIRELDAMEQAGYHTKEIDG
jgi:hypothetical protein